MQLRGFGPGESILVAFETGGGTPEHGPGDGIARDGQRRYVVCRAGQYARQAPGVGNGQRGQCSVCTYWTRESAYVSAGTPEPGRLVRIQFRGFAAEELVNARFGTQSGPELGSMVASITGGGSLAVRIPSSVSEGTHYVWLIGDRGNSARVSLVVSAAIEPTPAPTMTPTEVASGTPEPSSTPEPGNLTESPPAELTPTSSATATPLVPTETPTETALPETPTETPATATPADVAVTEPMADTATPSPTATDVNPEGT